MIAVYVVAGLFVGWLVMVVYRVQRIMPAGSVVAVHEAAAAGGGSCTAGDGSRSAQPLSLAVLVQDQADGVEGLVYRLAADSSCRPGQRIALVDGGSVDETGLILARLARWYNMDFYQLPGDETWFNRESVRLLDLRGIPATDLPRCDLSRLA